MADPTPDAADLNKEPINLINDSVATAHATLDVLLELTYADDAHERLESLGIASLSQVLHATMRRIEAAKEQANELHSRYWKARSGQEVTHG